MNIKQNKTAWSIALIIGIAGLTWLTSISNEFTGYDDLELIVNNPEIHQGFLHAIDFYSNYSSNSYSLAWSDNPSTIYRPLEWIMSAIGYSIWGASAWAYHIFINYSFHIVNSLLIFSILNKVVLNKQTDNEVPVSWFIPLVITLLWTVQPLHNEAINMLTSGVGFLSSTLFSLLAIRINLAVDPKNKLSAFALTCLGLALFFISFFGVEMLLIGPLVLGLIFSRSIIRSRLKSFKLYQVLLSFGALVGYALYRLSITAETSLIKSFNLNDSLERILVLAPQLFVHYLKLFFLPLKLTIDQHHNVKLANAFSAYHILCLGLVLLFFFAIFYFLSLKETKYKSHNRLIAGSLFFTILSIVIALNLFPTYCLARERYAYLFCLGLISSILLILDKYTLSKRQNKINWLILFYIVIILWGIRSSTRNLDWHNGTSLWSQTVESVDDIGAKQIWRYKLLQYYENPQITKPKADQDLQDFKTFASDNDLINKLSEIIHDSNKAQNYMRNKYAFSHNKSIAAALYATASRSVENSLDLLKLSHNYYPLYFQTNITLYLSDSLTEIQRAVVFEHLLTNAKQSPLWAQNLLKAMKIRKDPRLKELAVELQAIFPEDKLVQSINLKTN